MDLFIYLKKKKTAFQIEKNWERCRGFYVIQLLSIFPFFSLLLTNSQVQTFAAGWRDTHNKKTREGDVVYSFWTDDSCDIMSYRIWISSIIQMTRRIWYGHRNATLEIAWKRCDALWIHLQTQLGMSTQLATAIWAHTQERKEKKKDPSSKKKKKKTRGTPSLDVWSIRDEPSSLRKRKEKNVPSGYS